MDVTAKDMRTTTRTGPMPEHLKAWGETEATWDRCDAMWTRDFEERAFAAGVTIRGCPLGRGTTVEIAMRDLVRRTNNESELKLVWKGK
jgi:hypothetical protein